MVYKYTQQNGQNSQKKKYGVISLLGSLKTGQSNRLLVNWGQLEAFISPLEYAVSFYHLNYMSLC